MIHIQKNELPTRIDKAGATARQALNFGDASGYGRMTGECFSFGAGVDMSPFLKGLENDLCPSPHWGYVTKGVLISTDREGNTARNCEGELFYWPPGHSVRAEQDAEVVLFSPEDVHCKVVDHVKKKLEEK